MPTPLTACLIGVDGYGGVHYMDLMRQRALGLVRIIGATVINEVDVPEKCAKLRSLGCKLYTDYQSMLDELGGQSDLCCIPTGIHLHASMTMDALRAGANVLVEKPAAATIQDVRAMQRCEQETGRFVAVGYQTMYARETFWMKRAILDGKIGELQCIKSRGLWPRLDSYYQRNNWAGRLRRGDTWILDSPFNNALAHQLNMICFLAGTELEQTADLQSIEAELYRAREIESPDTACLRILTREGVPLFFYVTHASSGTVDPEIVIEGTRGTLRWTTSKVQLDVDGLRQEIPSDSWQELRDALMSHVFRRVADPSAFICTLGIAAAQTIAVNGAHDSSPVQAFPSRLVTREASGNSVKTVVAGLDEVMERAFTSNRLFSELGVAWACKGQTVSLSDYECFSGPPSILEANAR
ncbi:MAG: Gfo/Idh/MocA family protein [Chthoniobacteraceae bacterium]